jgi:hypothetical protein
MMCCLPCIVIDRRTDTAAFSHGPIVMTDPIKTDHRSSLLRRIAGWWRSAHVADDGEAAERDAGVNKAQPRTLAGKWPAAANPLRLGHLRCGAIDSTDADRMTVVR